MNAAGLGVRTKTCPCRTRIYFAVLETALPAARAGRRPVSVMPVEAAAHADGDLVLTRSSGASAVVRRLTAAERDGGVDEARYRAHMPHCPQRHRWPRPPRPRAARAGRGGRS